MSFPTRRLKRACRVLLALICPHIALHRMRGENHSLRRDLVAASLSVNEGEELIGKLTIECAQLRDRLRMAPPLDPIIAQPRPVSRPLSQFRLGANAQNMPHWASNGANLTAAERTDVASRN